MVVAIAEVINIIIIEIVTIMPKFMEGKIIVVVIIEVNITLVWVIEGKIISPIVGVDIIIGSPFCDL